MKEGMNRTIKVHIINPLYNEFFTRAYAINDFVGEKELTVALELKSKEKCSGITANWYEAKHKRFKGRSRMLLNQLPSEKDINDAIIELKHNMEGNANLQLEWCKEIGYLEEDTELDEY